jgi:cell division protein FtsB
MSQSAPVKFAPVFSLILIATSVYFSAMLIQTVSQAVRNQQRVQDLQREVSILLEQHTSLQQSTDQAQGANFIESEARNKLDLAKPSEIVVIFPEDSTVLAATSSVNQDPDTAGTPQPAPLSAWLRLFGNLKL